MINRVLVAVFVGLVVGTYPVLSEALNSGDHTQVTVTVAEQLGFSAAATELMGRASTYPDFDNWETPAAHAQTPNDENGKPTIDKAQAQCQCEAYLLGKAQLFKQQLDGGHVAITLFVLGYSLHTIQDFASHRGMTNSEHSDLAYGQHANPDAVTANIDLARTWTKDFLSSVQNVLGAQAWKQLTSGSSGNRVGRGTGPLCSDRGGSELCATWSCIGRCWG